MVDFGQFKIIPKTSSWESVISENTALKQSNQILSSILIGGLIVGGVLLINHLVLLEKQAELKKRLSYANKL